MFTQLHAMAQAATLLITAAADGDQLRVSITPSYPDGKVPAGATALRPLFLVATPAELDADFCAVLTMWQAPKLSVLEQAQAQVDQSDDDTDAPKASSKAVTKTNDKTKKDAKPARKSAPAAAITQDNANAHPQSDSAPAPGGEGADAPAGDNSDAAPVADPAAAAPAPVAAAAVPAPAGEPVLPAVDVYTIDLF